MPVAIYGSQRVRNWKSGCDSRRSRCSTASRSLFAKEPAGTRERQQEVAEQIFGEIKQLYAGLASSSGALRKQEGRGALRSLLRGAESG